MIINRFVCNIINKLAVAQKSSVSLYGIVNGS